MLEWPLGIASRREISLSPIHRSFPRIKRAHIGARTPKNRSVPADAELDAELAALERDNRERLNNLSREVSPGQASSRDAATAERSTVHGSDLRGGGRNTGASSREARTGKEETVGVVSSSSLIAQSHFNEETRPPEQRWENQTEAKRRAYGSSSLALPAPRRRGWANPSSRPRSNQVPRAQRYERNQLSTGTVESMAAALQSAQRRCSLKSLG
jgi:hypothetical protein